MPALKIYPSDILTVLNLRRDVSLYVPFDPLMYRVVIGLVKVRTSYGQLSGVATKPCIV